MGMEVYASKSQGVGGTIRLLAGDFLVEEVMVDGTIAKIAQKPPPQVLGSSPEEGNYLLCVLVKRNWDDFQAINMLSHKLNVSPKQIHIAGIKDTKAVTAQFITIKGARKEELRKIKIKDMEIKPVGYVRNKCSPYYLLGNSFTVTIRDLSHSKSTIQKRINRTVEELVAHGGVPNFFGHQRFGTTRPITHIVGKAIVKGNLMKATMLFLAKPSANEHPESRHAREDLNKTWDFKSALKKFPVQLRYERLMLRHLTRKPSDYAGAFRRLPLNLRRLFPQAYQAYLFNRFLSERIRRGIPLNKVESGDYVVNVERTGLPLLHMHKIVNSEILSETCHAIHDGKMRLAIPIVGYRQPLSRGIQGEIEKQILEEEDVRPEDFKVKGMPEISARGELRAATVYVNNFTMEVSKDSIAPSKHEANLHFMLHRGSYATVFLREIMKPRNPVKAGF